MYQKIYRVTTNGRNTRVKRPIEIYAEDANSTVLEFYVEQNGKPYEFTEDDIVKLHVQDPSQKTTNREIVYTTQDDQNLVTFLADKKGYVRVTLGRSVVEMEGQKLECILELFSQSDEDYSCRFPSFEIDILPSSRGDL